ncbi:immunoglobulin superfamily member 5 isoform X3 [Mus pahari]|uniref:immunoglobulin superfamily member 5 isoform X3 n=1 Tax=Mus pahari TaxID=10093 RepID=UPI001114DCFE|nr:immunoglobulin superfamily member 5 isoform X3 [Mus pahari]
MEGSWRDVLAVLVILAQLTASGSSYQIIEGPQNVTVLKGSKARFNCTVTHGWKLLMWTLNHMVVLSLTPQGPIITNDRFTYASYNSTDSFTSEMIIQDVRPSDSGPLQCSLQNSHGVGSAFLSVQVMGTLNIPSDNLIVTEGEPCNVTCYALGWTSLPDISWELEVPVSHSSYNSFLEPGNFMRVLSVLDLTPLGNGTLTCVAELKDLQASKSLTVNLTVVQPPPESTYQNEIRKSANVRTNTADPETKLKSGKENYGYSSDEARAAQTASLPPKSAEVSLPEKRSSSLPYQELNKQRLGPATHPRVSFDIASPQKVRNVTLV